MRPVGRREQQRGMEMANVHPPGVTLLMVPGEMGWTLSEQPWVELDAANGLIRPQPKRHSLPWSLVLSGSVLVMQLLPLSSGDSENAV